jgi:hypothetical protein
MGVSGKKPSGVVTVDMEQLFCPRPSIWARMSAQERRPHVLAAGARAETALMCRDRDRVCALHAVGVRWRPAQQEQEQVVLVIPSSFLRREERVGDSLAAGRSSFHHKWECGCCGQVQGNLLGLRSARSHRGLSLLRFVGLDGGFRTICTLCFGLLSTIRAMEDPPLNKTLLAVTLHSWLVGAHLVAVVVPPRMWREMHGNKKHVNIYEAAEDYAEWVNPDRVVPEHLLLPLTVTGRSWNVQYHVHRGRVRNRPRIPKRPVFFGPEPDPESAPGLEQEQDGLEQEEQEQEQERARMRDLTPPEREALDRFVGRVRAWKDDLDRWEDEYAEKEAELEAEMYIEIQRYLKQDMARCLTQNHVVVPRIASRLKKVLQKMKQDRVVMFANSRQMISTTHSEIRTKMRDGNEKRRGEEEARVEG